MTHAMKKIPFALAALACLLVSGRGYAQRSDDEDDEGPSSAAPAPRPSAVAPAPGPSAPLSSEPSAPAPAVPANLPPASAPKIDLVGGAPLGDPDVHVHIVERKPLADKGRSEVVLFPAVAQINGKFTTHVGAAAEYLYHFQENVAFQVTPMFFYVNGENAFNEDLVNDARLQAEAATALTMLWGGEAGVEATPLYGKFAFYSNKLAHFSLVLNAGVGATQTRVQLRQATDQHSATFGDTGYKFLGNVGGGFRVKLGESWAVRLEVRDLIYTAKVDAVNGCNFDDLTQIQGNGAPASASCRPDKFQEGDAQLARRLVQDASSDVLNQVAFFGGVAYIF